jgi:FMN phosphatase YigB (HAD superfamily)
MSQKRNKLGVQKPVVAIDIDGTLGDFHGHFLRFAQEWYGRAMPDPTEINPGLPLHKFMRTSKATYRQCKLAYRQGGLERSMPAYPGASELTVQLRRGGCEVWICTTRPYLKHDTQSPNTVHWLRRNGIQWDHMLSGPHKYRDLVKQVGKERVVAVLDDLPEMIEQANSLGLWTMIRDQPYNRHFQWHYRAHDLFEAQRTIVNQELDWWYHKQ